MRERNDNLDAQTLAHFLESGLQDNTVVVFIIIHVLKSLKTQNPELTDAYFQQDNAGCFHCANTILSCNALSQKTGIRIRQLDFSDPQGRGGKGACDRKLKQHKSSLITPDEFLQAILSHGGIGGLRVVVVRSRQGSWKRSIQEKHSEVRRN